MGQATSVRDFNCFLEVCWCCLSLATGSTMLDGALFYIHARGIACEPPLLLKYMRSQEQTRAIDFETTTSWSTVHSLYMPTLWVSFLDVQDKTTMRQDHANSPRYSLDSTVPT